MTTVVYRQYVVCYKLLFNHKINVQPIFHFIRYDKYYMYVNFTLFDNFFPLMSFQQQYSNNLQNLYHLLLKANTKTRFCCDDFSFQLPSNIVSFTWYRLHRSALSQCHREGREYHCRWPQRGRTVLHFHFPLLQGRSLGLCQHRRM